MQFWEETYKTCIIYSNEVPESSIPRSEMFGSDRKECAASDGSLSPVKLGGSYQCSPEQNAPVTVPTARAAAEGKCPF